MLSKETESKVVTTVDPGPNRALSLSKFSKNLKILY
jgi:hypothetical protein